MTAASCHHCFRRLRWESGGRGFRGEGLFCSQRCGAEFAAREITERRTQRQRIRDLEATVRGLRHLVELSRADTPCEIVGRSCVAHRIYGMRPTQKCPVAVAADLDLNSLAYSLAQVPRDRGE